MGLYRTSFLPKPNMGCSLKCKNHNREAQVFCLKLYTSLINLSAKLTSSKIIKIPAYAGTSFTRQKARIHKNPPIRTQASLTLFIPD